MIFRFILTALLYSLFRGLNEAMVMFQPNIRDHPWFAWYHSGRIIEAAMLVICSIIAFKWHLTAFLDARYRNILWKYLMSLFGVFTLSWEVFEIAYWFGRMGQVNGHENLLGIWSIDTLMAVIAIHVVRFLIGIFCLWKGDVL